MTARPGQHYIVTRYVRMAQSAIAAMLGAVAVLLWQHVPSDSWATSPPSTHISIPRPLFDIADSVCSKNGGYKDVVIERKSDQFTFRCADGMTLRDTIVRIK